LFVIAALGEEASAAALADMLSPMPLVEVPLLTAPDAAGIPASVALVEAEPASLDMVAPAVPFVIGSCCIGAVGAVSLVVG